MDEIVKEILDEQNMEKRIAGMRKLNTARALMELATRYHWEDGWEIPLMMVIHARCDLGLALFLFWEFEEARLYFHNQWKAGPGDEYRLAFCQTLVEGLLKGRYPIGENKYDTGFYGMQLSPQGSYEGLVRAVKTIKAREQYPEALLYPVL